MPENGTYSRRNFLCAGGGLLGGSLLSRFEGSASGVAVPPAAQPPRKVPVIDCHVHIGHPEQAAPTGDALLSPWTSVGTELEELLRFNEEAGIDYSVIMPITPRGGTRFANFGKANAYIAKVCREYPDKFIGFVKHDVINEKGRLRSMLLHEYHELGLRGLKMHQQPTAEILDTMAELGMPILYHPRPVAKFEEVVAAYPKVNMIMAHMGRDEEPYARYIANRYPNAYLGTSNVVTTRHIEMAVREVPAEKIVFGSDEPLMDCRHEIFKIRVLGLPKEKQELILGGNMLRLLGGRVG